MKLKKQHVVAITAIVIVLIVSSSLLFVLPSSGEKVTFSTSFEATDDYTNMVDNAGQPFGLFDSLATTGERSLLLDGSGGNIQYSVLRVKGIAMPFSSFKSLSFDFLPGSEARMTVYLVANNGQYLSLITVAFSTVNYYWNGQLTIASEKIVGTYNHDNWNAFEMRRVASNATTVEIQLNGQLLAVSPFNDVEAAVLGTLVFQVTYGITGDISVNLDTLLLKEFN